MTKLLFMVAHQRQVTQSFGGVAELDTEVLREGKTIAFKYLV